MRVIGIAVSEAPRIYHLCRNFSIAMGFTGLITNCDMLHRFPWGAEVKRGITADIKFVWGCRRGLSEYARAPEGEAE
jgi:hypothetical protein